MRAVFVTAHGGPEVLDVRDVPEPRPGEGQVLIRVVATGVNFADIMARRGKYAGAPPPPFIVGLDVAGTITEVGPGVTGLQVGQRVAAFPQGGSYAEMVVAPAVLTFPLPDGLDWDTAAAFPTVGITSYNLLTLAGRLGKGETVLVHAAAGGVGTTVLQLARILGAGLVIGTVGSDEKADLARSLGADVVLNYRQEDVVGRVRERTGGAGADLVLDAVGAATFEASLACLAPFGRVVLFGQASGPPPAVASGPLYGQNKAVIGYSTGGYRALRPAALRPVAEAVLDLLAQRRLKLLVTARYPLAAAAAAQRFVESGASTGKVLLIP